MKNLLFFTVLLSACQSDPQASQQAEQPTRSNDEQIAGRPVPIDSLTLEESKLDSAYALPVQRRDRRRMNIFQLNQALTDLTGYDYTELLEARGPLGQPDYREIIHEVREPELFFQKFLQDAAHTNCDHLLDDEETATLSERKFLTQIEPNDTTQSEVKANLAFLLLRYHGHRYETSSAEVEEWYSLFSTIQQTTSDSQTTWKAICVGLIRHPDFYSY